MYCLELLLNVASIFGWVVLAEKQIISRYRVGVPGHQGTKQSRLLKKF